MKLIYQPAINTLSHLTKEVKWKGAAKLGRVLTAECHKQSGLKCTGCGPLTVGWATTGFMVRQRSMRRKPLYLVRRPFNDLMEWKGTGTDLVGHDVLY